jgi:YggT family protein
MQLTIRLLGSLLSLYSFLIFVRILLTWFSGFYFGGVYNFLCRLTDPYVTYFRRFGFFRIGNIDLSPIAAMAVLQVATNVTAIIGSGGRISIGFVAALLISTVWSVVSFVIAFFAVVLALRLAAYLLRANIYSGFWRIIEAIAAPVLYRINKIFFRNKPAPYLQGMIISLVILILILVAGGVGIKTLTRFLILK